MYYVGLDVHQKRTSVCILNHQGRRVKEFTVLGDWDQLLAQLQKELPADEPCAFCFEASAGCGVLCDRLGPLAQRIEVAHPGKVRLIFQAKRKNDRVDGRKLATLLYLDQVPKAYIPDASIRGWRGLVEFRRATVDKRTRTKNGLRALLRNCGIQKIAGLPRKLPQKPVTPGSSFSGGSGGSGDSGDSGGRKRLWAKKGVAVLRELPLPTVHDRLRRDLLLEELEQYETQLQRIAAELDVLAEDHAGVALLQSIPGVGPRTAEAVLAYIDRPQRFRRNKQVGAYFGLVPCQDSSGAVNRLGHITREGPPTVRKLLVEAAWQGIRHSPTLKAYYDQVCQGKKERRKIALVATAHHLVRIMHSMLQSGEWWRETPASRKSSPESGTIPQEVDMPQNL